MKLLKRLPATKLARVAFLSFFYLYYLCCNCFAFAENDIGELEISLNNMQDDTSKVNTLIKLGKHYCSIDNEKALTYLQEALNISNTIDYEIGKGRSLLWHGRVFYYKDEYILSERYYDWSKQVLEGTDDIESLAFLSFAKAVNSRITGAFINALELYEKAIELFKQNGNLKMMSSCYSGIGIILLERKELRKALGYFQETLEIKESIADLPGMSNVFTLIGLCYEEIGALDTSLIFHNKALKIRTELKIYRSIASSEYNRGGVFIKMGKYKEAEESLQTAFDGFSAFNEKTGVIISKLRLANAQNKLGKPIGIQNALDALEMAKKISNPNLISHTYKILAEIYAFNANYEQSYKCLVKHDNLNDSLFNTEKEKMLVEFEARFQSEKKDGEIQLLKSKTKIQQQNNLLLIIFIIVFALITILLIFLFRLKSTAFNRQQMLRAKEKVIHQQKQKITENETQILQENLETKNRELASKALEMMRYNDAISSIIEKLENLNNNFGKNAEVEGPIKDIIHDLENHTKQNIWTEFDKIFKNIHSDFYSRLLQICPELSATEIKTAALLKLNLTTKEIAAISFKSEGGVKTTRYRLRKKLNLSSDEKLIPYLLQV